VTKEAKPRKEKKAKDPDAVRSVLRECLSAVSGPSQATDPRACASPQPKRPTSAYFYYAADQRPEIKKTDPGLCARPRVLLSLSRKPDARPCAWSERRRWVSQGRDGGGQEDRRAVEGAHRQGEEGAAI